MVSVKTLSEPSRVTGQVNVVTAAGNESVAVAVAVVVAVAGTTGARPCWGFAAALMVPLAPQPATPMATTARHNNARIRRIVVISPAIA